MHLLAKGEELERFALHNRSVLRGRTSCPALLPGQTVQLPVACQGLSAACAGLGGRPTPAPAQRAFTWRALAHSTARRTSPAQVSPHWVRGATPRVITEDVPRNRCAGTALTPPQPNGQVRRLGSFREVQQLLATGLAQQSRSPASPAHVWHACSLLPPNAALFPMRDHGWVHAVQLCTPACRVLLLVLLLRSTCSTLQ